MGTKKPKHSSPTPTVTDVLAWFFHEEQELDIILPYFESEEINDTVYRQYAKPSLPSDSFRYSPPQQRSLAPDEPGCAMYVHPEGRPYYRQNQLLTIEDMRNPEVATLVSRALAIICFVLKRTHDCPTKSSSDIEFCIELESSASQSQFRYYMVDRRKRQLFWASSQRPIGIERANETTRANILREEYWKHVEYYPCHHYTTLEDYEELKSLLAAHATDAATSEGSTSPMSAEEIRQHIRVLETFGNRECPYKTWAIARLFGLFIRGQIVNLFGTQNARLDRFASLDAKPPKFDDHYALINSHLTINLGTRHLRRCARTWADRIAYTESWRVYKSHYLQEWKQIRYLACVIVIVCSNIYGRTTSLILSMLTRVAGLLAIMSTVLSYYLSDELINFGDHAADAALYFQAKEQMAYGVQRLALTNCAPQAALVWSTGFLVLTVLL